MIRPIDITQTSTDNEPGRSLTPTAKANEWSAVEPSAIPELAGVDPSQGLLESEVAARRLRYGANSTAGRGARRVTLLLLMLFLSVAIGFLMTAAILNSAITDRVEAFSILAITLLGAIVGFAYLLKSARAVDRMADATRTYAFVRRGGNDVEVNAEELVPGDIIMLEAGEYVPADCRLLKSAQLRVEESALNGETASIDKQSKQMSQARSMLFLGTEILSGTALAAVVATGFQTELGRRATGDR